MPSITKFLSVLSLLLSVAACSVPMIPGITPHKMDIQQGNVVTQDMVAKLKPGMSRSQVRFALGTPLVVDAFHKDRWDYVYVLKKAGRVTEQRRIVVLFAEDKLVRIDGDVVPGGPRAAADETPPAPKAESVGPTPTGGEPVLAEPRESEPPAAQTSPLR